MEDHQMQNVIKPFAILLIASPLIITLIGIGISVAQSSDLNFKAISLVILIAVIVGSVIIAAFDILRWGHR